MISTLANSTSIPGKLPALASITSHLRMGYLPQRFLLASMACLALAAPAAHAADNSCKAVTKAGEAALANARIHQALYMPVKDAKGARLPATAPELAHFIVLADKTEYTSMGKDVFSITPPNERGSGAYYAQMIASIDEGCRTLGKATLGGRAALVFEQGGNKKADDILFKIWIDSATGLPLRADLDEAEVVSTMTKDKNGLPKFSAKKSDDGKRQVNSVAFLFGDAVKAPTLNAKKNNLGVLNKAFGTAGTLDAQAMATVLALLN